MLPKTRPALFTALGPRLMRWYSRTNVALYRATGGRVGGHELGKPVCLLTTTGRKTGLARTNALVYLADGDRVLLVPAQGGLPTHPMWLLNLRADPRVQVQIGPEVRAMRAREADEAERAELWPRVTALNPRWARFQSWTDRVIPVVICEPVPTARE